MGGNVKIYGLRTNVTIEGFGEDENLFTFFSITFFGKIKRLSLLFITALILRNLANRKYINRLLYAKRAFAERYIKKERRYSRFYKLALILTGSKDTYIYIYIFRNEKFSFQQFVENGLTTIST